MTIVAAFMVVPFALLSFAGTELLASLVLGEPFVIKPKELALSLGVVLAVTFILLQSGYSLVSTSYYAIVYAALASLSACDLRSGYVPNLALLPLTGAIGLRIALHAHAFTNIFAVMLLGGCALALHVTGGGASFGLGDVKLLALVGGAFGAERGVYILGLAFILGSAISIALIGLGRYSRRDTLPFVPMIGLSALWQSVSHAH